MRQIKHFNAGGDEIRWCGRLEVWHIQTRHVSLIRLLCHSSSLLSEGTQRCFWRVVHEWVVVTILGEHKILLYRLTLRPYRGEPCVRRGRQRTPPPAHGRPFWAQINTNRNNTKAERAYIASGRWTQHQAKVSVHRLTLRLNVQGNSFSIWVPTPQPPAGRRPPERNSTPISS
jgi:hypothetical protein